MSTDTMQPSDALERAHKEIVDRIELTLNQARQNDPDSPVVYSHSPVRYLTDEYMFITGANTEFYLKDAESIKPDLTITVDTTDITALVDNTFKAEATKPVFERRVTMLVPKTSILYYNDDEALCHDTYLAFTNYQLEQPDFYALDDFVYNRFAGLDYAHACVHGLVQQ